MLRHLGVALTGLLLAGCANPFGSAVPTSAPADPLGDVELLSDVVVGDVDTAVALAASSGDTAGPSVAGLFSGLFGRAPSSDPDQAGSSDAAAGTPPPQGTGPDAQVIPFGTQIPFAEVATVCDAPRGALGTRVASASGYEIFDSIPNSTAPRPHYITGFPDGCVRQFTAALALMGDVGTHEFFRYSSANRRQDYSVTDNAYEAVKASYCRVGFGERCGSRIDALAGRTTFVSVYERFGDNQDWFEIFLHEGAVKAVGMEEF